RTGVHMDRGRESDVYGYAGYESATRPGGPPAVTLARPPRGRTSPGAAGAGARRPAHPEDGGGPLRATGTAARAGGPAPARRRPGRPATRRGAGRTGRAAAPGGGGNPSGGPARTHGPRAPAAAGPRPGGGPGRGARPRRDPPGHLPRERGDLRGRVTGPGRLLPRHAGR